MNERFVDPVLALILKGSGAVFIGWGAVLVITPIGMMKWFLRMVVSADHFSALWALAGLLFFLLRTTGALCIFAGASYLVAARDPRRHAPWVRISGALLLFYAAVSFTASILYGPPYLIFIFDSALAAVGALLVLKFSRRPELDNN